MKKCHFVLAYEEHSSHVHRVNEYDGFGFHLVLLRLDEVR